MNFLHGCHRVAFLLCFTIGCPRKKLNPSSTPYFSKIIQPVNELYMQVLRYIIHIHMCEISARLLYIF